jgi:hypothetical protein
MSRSYREPIIKDRPRNYKKSTWYWRTIRRITKMFVKQGKDVPNPKSIINDYDYCDWTFNADPIKGKRK